VKSPEVAIKKGNEQGECWPMAGTAGSLVVDLANAIHIGSITLMHIHPQLAPNGDVSSALKDFKVWAYPSDGGERFEIVSGVFDSNAGCGTFPVKGDKVINGLVNQPIRQVALEVLSNHGREELTCIYRFMVHGQP
jgi:SUN domain-containing protein 1/2